MRYALQAMKIAASILILLLLPSIACSQVTVAVSPVPHQQFFDQTTGLPLASGCLYTYITGTSTPLATYTDGTGTAANANPVILGADGGANLWLANSSYRFTLYSKGTGGTQGSNCFSGTFEYTIDNVSAYTIINSAQNLFLLGQGSDPGGTAGELIYRNDIPCARFFTVSWDCLVTLTGNQILTNKTFNVSTNTLSTSAPITGPAGHFLRNNGTSYQDNGIQLNDVQGVTWTTGGNSTATILNSLAKLNGTGGFTISATTDTGGAVGVCIAGCSSSAPTIQGFGPVTCTYDGGTALGDYVQISSSVAGDCHDAGATYPSNGQVIGRVWTGSLLGGNTLLFGAEIKPPVSVKSLNSVQYADQFAGADASVKTNACIAQVITNGGGTCDANGLGGAQTISVEIDVGNHAQVPVTLRLPQASTWTVGTITNGTSCAIKQFSQSVIIGGGTGGSSAMVINAGAGTNNLDSMYCTEASPTGMGSYIRAEGFQLYNPNGATMANGAMNVQAIFDNSSWTNITVASYGTVGLNVHGIFCCGASFDHFTANGNHVANSIPVQVNLNVASEVAFHHLSADHPGNGKNAVVITGIANTRTVRIYDLYSEGNNADNVTPNISVGTTAGLVEFYGVTCNNNGTSTAYCIDIPNAGTPRVNVYGLQQTVGGSINCINDHYSGKTYACDPTTGNMSFYAMGGLQAGSQTVAQLPAAGVNNAGQIRVVSDSTAIAVEGQVCAGAGVVTALAFSSGVAWKCF
jgi:hypothetical protein